MDIGSILGHFQLKNQLQKERATMGDWNKEFHGISIKCNDKLVQIKNDKALNDFLNDPKSRGSVLIADYVLELYKKELGKKLNISRNSLAIEILGHVYMDVFAGLASTMKPLETAMKSIRSHTDVIDCGEKDVDGNRFVWDDLAQGPFKGMVFVLCGKKA